MKSCRTVGGEGRQEGEGIPFHHGGGGAMNCSLFPLNLSLVLVRAYQATHTFSVPTAWLLFYSISLHFQVRGLKHTAELLSKVEY